MEVNKLKQGIRTLEKNIMDLINEFEEEYDFRTAGMEQERDPESRVVTAIVIPIFDEGVYG